MLFLFLAGKCIKITDEKCADVGYSYTAFPSFDGSITEQDAGDIIKLIASIDTATHCYKHAILFACVSMLPRCRNNSAVPHHIVPPCRSICEGQLGPCYIILLGR